MKTKVVSFRVTTEQYEALEFLSKNAGQKMGEFIAERLYTDFLLGIELVANIRKRAEAKAKRDAKKAANGVQ